MSPVPTREKPSVLSPAELDSSPKDQTPVDKWTPRGLIKDTSYFRGREHWDTAGLYYAPDNIGQAEIAATRTL
ncbi:hypothetical protein TSAR_009094 [Trichomalopsis sarcophagae]|uniref:Uncharacterized protein n=1 Tax=Trichomalopsis sarcophagae TaxID=543379 RepID=A0A232FGD4_9HYME|nr:hypothetical protein TSAR_009094 [Trichomalopsis sarcophagae]